jgi:L-rhamnonate dehydratase
MTELVRIVDEAEIGGRRVVTHGASSYGMHLAFARSAVPFGECILAGESGVIRPFFGGLFVAEPLPVTGSLELKQLSAPGFGLELNPSCSLVRPTITGRLEV